MKKLGKLQKDQKDIDKWQKQVKRFTENAKTKGLSVKEAEHLAEDMVKFSGYSFNKSHAMSYTLIACITLFLSYYYRKYYYSALLSYNLTKEEDDISLTVNAIKANGIKLVPPNINLSKEHLSVDGDDIVFGLADIKTISDKPYSKISVARPFNSFIDFILKTKSKEVNSTVITALISVGCFDEFTKERVRLLFAFNKFWEEKKQIKVEEKLKLIWERCWVMAKSIPGLETTPDKLMEFERKYFGINIFTSSFDADIMKALAKMKSVGLINMNFTEVSESAKKTPVVIKSIRTLNDKNGKEMAFLEIEDCIGNKLKIPVFQSFWMYLKDCFVIDGVYLVSLFRKEDDQIMFGSEKFIKDEIKILSLVKKLKINA